MKSKCILDVVNSFVHVPNVSYNVIYLCDSIVKGEGILHDSITGQVGTLILKFKMNEDWRGRDIGLTLKPSKDTKRITVSLW